MAVGTLSDFKIFNDEIQAGYSLAVTQNTDAFNASSNNAIRLIPMISRGNYRDAAFFKTIANLVTRRVATSVSEATKLKLEQGSLIQPKLKRKVGPVQQTIDSFVSAGLAGGNEEAMRQFSFDLGVQLVPAVLQDYLDTALIAAVACMTKQSSTQYSLLSASTKTLNYKGLVRANKTFGDNAQKVVAYVMHSSPFYDLMGDSLNYTIDSVAGMTIYQGDIRTFNKPVIVTDSSALVKADGVTTGQDSYYNLALTEMGIDVIESVSLSMLSDIVLGNENIEVIMQGEHAYNIKVNGYSAGASAQNNPDDTALGSSSNWTLAYSDIKHTAGFIIESAEAI